MKNRVPSPSRFPKSLVRALIAIPVVLVFSASAANAAEGAAPRAVTLKLPADVIYDRVVGADSAVVFRHTTHVDYESGRCTGCHPGRWRLLTPTRRASHREMNAGGSCGACHDGRHAFDVRATESCASCHAGRKAAQAVTATTPAGAPAAFRGPAPITYRRAEGSPGRVTFRHATHVGPGMKCADCHPKPFAMKSTGPRPDGAMHEQSACGMCHDGRKSFGVEDEKACARCHVEGKAAS